MKLIRKAMEEYRGKPCELPDELPPMVRMFLPPEELADAHGALEKHRAKCNAKFDQRSREVTILMAKLYQAEEGEEINRTGTPLSGVMGMAPGTRNP